jgi:hypothetical protein
MEDCQAVRDRQEVTRGIQKACNPREGAWDHLPDDGSERSLVIAFSVLHGIVNEYFNGGDQMAENCTCGKHAEQSDSRWRTSEQLAARAAYRLGLLDALLHEDVQNALKPAGIMVNSLTNERDYRLNELRETGVDTGSLSDLRL